MKLLTNSTPIALWYEIIHEAETACTISLKEEVEAYLVFLLMRYIDKPEIVKHIMASEFLTGIHLDYHQRELALQGVGDKCLIFSGLFPSLAEKRHTKISYFVHLGQAAYLGISRDTNDLYESLATYFVPLMDVLQSIRRQESLPLQAYELWNETGSQMAFNSLRRQTQSLPIRIIPNK